jgi:aminoglycoside phosphotransferase (APT) family kinase protein
MNDTALFDLPEADVARALLPYLCEHAGVASLTFARSPTRMLGGFDSLIYDFALRDPPAALAGPLVLRVYRDARGPERAHCESSVQNAVAEQGFPTPRVVLTCVDRGVLGGAFLIMQRLPGRVMLDAFFSPRILRMPALLARLHVELHALDVERFRSSLAAAGCPLARLAVAGDLDDMQSRITRAQLAGLQSGMRWILAQRPSAAAHTAICHGDFHPLNVLLEDDRVSGVLDWAWSKIGDPAWDVGATVALISQGPVNLPAILQGAARAVRRMLVDRYVRAYTAARPLDLGAVRYYEAMRCLGMLIEAGEHRQAERWVIAPVAKPTAFAGERAARSLMVRFRAISQVDVTLPNVRAADGGQP